MAKQKYIAFLTLCFLLFGIIAPVYAEDEDTQQNFQNTQPFINSIQTVNPNLPTTVPEQKGTVGQILSKLFIKTGPDQGKIGNWFLRMLGTRENGRMMRWVGGNGGKLEASTIYDDGTYVSIGGPVVSGTTFNVEGDSRFDGDLNVVGDFFQNGSPITFSGKFVDGTDSDDAVYVAGNVGIGTSNPGANLTVENTGIVKGAFKSTSDGTNDHARINIYSGTADTSGGYIGAFHGNYGSTAGALNLRDRFVIRGFPETSNGVMINSQSGGVFFSDSINADSQMSLVQGNLGIGTTNPNYELSVIGQGVFIDGTSSNSYGVLIGGDTTNGYGEVRALESGVGPRNLMINRQGGNVGIGTSVISTGLKLDVEGKVGATEFCDENGQNCFSPNNVTLSGSSLGGAGTANYITKFTGTGSSIGDSIIYDTGTNIGIGTNSPGVRLDVLGDARFENITVAEAGQINFTDATHYIKSRLAGGGYTGSDILFGSQHDFYFIADNNNNDTTSDFIFGVDGLDDSSGTYSEVMRITDSGDVGIGTNSPAGRLDVSGSGNVFSYVRTSGGGDATLRLRTPDSEYGLIAKGGGSDGFGLYDYENSEERITVSSAGNVGIGDTTPGAKLEVAGNVIASEPTAGGHLTTKNYVDTLVAAGISWKAPVGAGSTPAGVYGACDSAKEGWAAYSLDDDIVYLCNGSAWISIGSSASIPYATTTSPGKIQIAGDIGGVWNNITINNNAVNSAKIQDGTVTALDLAADSVGTSEVANNSLTASDLAIDSVGASELAADSVGTSEVANNSLTALDIAGDAITSSELADNAVTSSNIVDGTIGSDDLGNNSVGTSEITDGVITNADISVTAAIAGSKISPNFGTQTLTAGQVRANSGLVVDGKAIVSGSQGAAISSHYTDDSRYGYFQGYNDSGDRGYYLGYGNGGSIVGLHLDNASILNISGGDVRINGGLELITGGSQAEPGISFISDSDTGIYSNSPDTLRFTAGGSLGIAIDDSANVGIGTASPNAKLEVNGNIIADDPTVSSHVATKNYVDGTITQTIGSGSIVIDSLGDARTDTTSVFLGEGAGITDDGSSNNNVALGVNALQFNTTGYNNTAIGGTALRDNTTGYNNTAIGRYALLNNETASNNIAIGRSSLGLNTTGAQNTAIGTNTLDANVSGDYNTALGYNALTANTASHNTAIGAIALDVNTTGNFNTALGYGGLGGNTIGIRNTAVGYNSLNSNVSGGYNTALGMHSLYLNTASNNTAVGYEALRNNTTGARNVALGNYTLDSNITGIYNTGIGYQSLSNSTGDYNTALGYQSLIGTTTGASNIGIGRNAGDNITTGSSNIIIGTNIDAPSATASNQLNIGNWIYGDNGNIGVGVSSPESTLEIAKLDNNFLTLDTQGNTEGSIQGIQFKDRHNASNQGADGQITSFIRSERGGGSAVYDLSFGTVNTTDGNATEKLRILANGNVNIGGGALSVSGTVTGAEPILASHLTTKNYVDTLVSSGVSWKAPVPTGSTPAATYGACDAAKEGWATYNIDDNIVYLCNASSWVSIGSTASIPNATTTTAGKIQIAGDIEGTWNNITIKDNVIGSSNIADNSLQASDLAPGSVGASEVASNSINSIRIVDNTVTAADIAANAIGASELADNSVTNANIIDGTILGADISDGTILSADIGNNTITETDISDAFVARDSSQLGGVGSGSYLRSDIDDSLTATTKVTGSFIHEDSPNMGYISHPNGGYYRSTLSSETGAIRICLPTHGTADMIGFKADIYDHAANESVTVGVFGYLYQSTGNNEWATTTANVSTTSASKDYTIRFGANGANNCVWIGETTSTWGYPQVVVRDFFAGYTSDIDAYDDGWSISVETTFDTIDETHANNLPYADWSKIKGRPATFDLTPDTIADDGIIQETEIAQNTLDDSEIQNNSLTAASLATGSVGTDEVANNTLTASDLAANSVGNSELIDNPEVSNLSIYSGVGNGIRFWNSDAYKISMGNTAEYQYGPVSDYSIKSNMSGSGRGWTWGSNGATPAAALGLGGIFQTSNYIQADGGFRVDGRTMISDNGASHTARFINDTRYGYFQGYNNSGDRGYYLGYGNGGSVVDLLLDNASRLDITGGDVRLSGDLQLPVGGSQSNPGISFVGDPNTGIYSNTADTLRFTAGGNLGIGIDTSGNVGIGTAGPNAKLQVVGNVIASEPTASNHLTTKNYVDTLLAAGVSWKAPVPSGSTPAATYGACDAAKEGWATYNESDDAVYLCNGSAWVTIGSTASIPYATTSTAGKVQIAGDIEGTWNNVTIKSGVIDSANIANGTIVQADLAANSVAASEIATGAVGASEIATGAVGTDEVANNSLTAADLAIDSVGASELAANAVGTAEIADNSILAGDIAGDAIGASELADNAVASANIINNTITETDISDSFVARDSSLLDGIDSTAFLRSNANDTFTGKLYPTNTNTRSAGIYGVYDATRIGHIWSMGSGYAIPDDGSNFGNLYGFAYKHTNNPTGGTMANGHQAVWVANGVPRVALGTNIWTSGDVLADDVNISGAVLIDGKTMISSDGGNHSVHYSNDTRYGYFQGYNNSGDRGYYFGWGDGDTNVDLHLDNASRFDITGGDVYVADNIGIGTAVPIAKLDVRGDIAIESDGDGNFGFITQAGENGIGLASSLSRIGSPELYVSEVNGNVGLGTITPDYNLEVVDVSTVDNIEDADISLRAESTSILFHDDQNGAGTNTHKWLIGEEGGFFRIQSDHAGFDGFTEHLTIDTIGNTGFGETTPLARVHVNGNVIADDPTASNHLTTKSYVDGQISGGAVSINDLSDAITNPGSVFLGNNSGIADDGTNYNVGVGPSALRVNTSGINNIALGRASLYSNTTANNNIALGRNSMYANTTGAQNIALGTYALDANVSGLSNTAIGYNTLTNNTASYNIAIGGVALDANTTGDYNVGMGYNVLGSNTTGIRNIGIGTNALAANVSGNYNLAIGVNSLASATGNNNVGVGYVSLSATTTGENNTAVGYAAGDNITTGSSNIIIGNLVNAPSATANNQLNIGDWIYGDNGDIGIGTDSPVGQLSIVDSSNTKYNLTLDNGGSTAKGLLIEGGNTGSDASLLRVQNNSATPFFEVTDGNSYFNNGNLGVGTSSPSARLDVVGDAEINGGLEIQSGGSQSNPRFSIIGDSDTGIYSNAANTLRFAAGGNLGIGIDPSGNVGIGTAGPSAKLQVVGNVIASDPTAANHLTTKNYVDTLVQGLSWKEPVPTSASATYGTCNASKEGWTTYNQSDNVIYMCNASAWVNIGSTAVIPNATTTTPGKVQLSGDIGGTWNNVTLNTNTVDSSNIVNSSITGEDILNSTITNADIAVDTITSTRLATGSVGSAEIANGTIVTADLANNSVASGNIIDGTITAADLAADSVGASELANDAVASANVVNNSLTASDLAPNSVGASEINDGAVRTEEISNNTITEDDISDSFVARDSTLIDGTNSTDIRSTNLLDGVDWVDGPNGSLGDFGMYGVASENRRVWLQGPHGNRTMVWQAVPDGTGGADGGWGSNDSFIDVDTKKSYRLSVWIRRTGSRTAGGTYFGTGGGGINNLDNTANTNPYFFIGDLPEINKWYLMVGYIHASDDTSTVSYGGIYDGVTGEKVVSTTDFKLQTTTPTHIRHRTFIIGAGLGDRNYWWNPRIDQVNGNEPSITALLNLDTSGFDTTPDTIADDGIIQETEIAQNTLDDSEIADNSLTANSLAVDSVGQSELAPNAVGSANIQDGNVRTQEILDDTITETDISDSFVARSASKVERSTGYTWMGDMNTTPRSIYDKGLAYGAVGSTNNNAPVAYGTLLNIPSWGASQDGGAGQIIFPYDQSYSGNGNPMFRVGDYNNAGWATWKTFLDKDWADTLYVGIGDAIPGDTITDGTIDSSEIEDNTITATDLSANSVASSELAGTLTYTDTNANTSYSSLTLNHDASGATALTADRTHRGLYIDMDSSATGGNTTEEHRLYGVYSDVRATGDSDLVHAAYNFAQSNHTSGTITTVRGAYNYGASNGTAPTTQVMGTQSLAQIGNTGLVNTSYATYNKTLKLSTSTNTTTSSFGSYNEIEIDAGIITDAYGVQSVIDKDAGTITNGYLFHGDYQGALPTNAWGIYIADVVNNYFGGNVQVGANDTGNQKTVTIGGGTTNEGGEIRLSTAANSDTTYDYYFMDAYQDDLRIGREGIGTDIVLKHNGNVGIGIADPIAKLHIRGTGGSTEGIRLSNANKSAIIYFGDNSGTSDLVFSYGGTSNAQTRFQENGNIAFIPNGGSEGISIGSAVISSDLRLDVAGKVGATEYCDENGANCTDAAKINEYTEVASGTSPALSSASNDGVSPPIGSVPTFFRDEGFYYIDTGVNCPAWRDGGAFNAPEIYHAVLDLNATMTGDTGDSFGWWMDSETHCITRYAGPHRLHIRVDFDGTQPPSSATIGWELWEFQK